MKISIATARGEIPRAAPRLLPTEYAQIARNVKLLSGDIQPWRAPAHQLDLAKSGTVNTIHLMDRDKWLHWVDSELGSGAVEVDVARGPTAGDTTERTYFAGLDAPRVTNIAKAIGSCSLQYPCDSLLLGVPAPTEAPEVSIDVLPPDTSNITLTNPGAESGGTAGWIVVSGDLDVHDEDDVAGQTPYTGTYYFFGGNVAATEAYQTVDLAVAGVFETQEVTVTYRQASGINGGLAAMGIRFYNASSTLIGEVEDTLLATTPTHTWVERSISGQVPVGATTMRIVMFFERTSGTESDGYIDAITATAKDFSQSYDCSNFDGWTKGPVGGATQVDIDPAVGRPGPSWRFQQNNSVSYIYKDVGLDKSPKSTFQFDAKTIENFHFVLYASPLGRGYSVHLGDRVRIARNDQWSQESPPSSAVISSVSVRNRWVRVTVNCETVDEVSAKIVVRVVDLDNGTVYTDDYEGTVETFGALIGFKSRSNETSERSWCDNIALELIAPEGGAEEELTFANYVYVFANEFGQVGPQSPISRTLQRGTNAPVTVLTPVTAPAGYGITHKWIFRSATGTNGTIPLLVAKIPLEQDSYTDAKADKDLGEALYSQNYDLPPTDMRGLIALPNGIMIGFAQNQVVPSVQLQPHAYPVEFRLATDFPIVAIGAIDADVVVLTESFPYVVTGYQPDALSMKKLEYPYACVSKRSVANLRGYGVVYASPDGLVAIGGQAAPVLLTDQLLTRDQWQALKPETINGIAHDDRYFGFYDKGGGDRGAFILDPKPGGFGLVFLDIWAQAAFSDHLTDQLYLVIDNEVWLWEGATELLNYLWRSKLFQLPTPTAFSCAQVRAADYDDLTVKLYADGSGTPFLTIAVASAMEFRLPEKLCSRSIEIEVAGTSRVEMIEIAEEMEELT